MSNRFVCLRNRFSRSSVSLETSSRYAADVTDLRPTSATSSVRSQDSGVAQSDPKTSIDCSAKSETSPAISSTLTRHRSPSNPIQQLLTTMTPNHQHELFESNNEQLREKLQPLNTTRLKPYRQATKSMIVNRIFSYF